MIVESYSFNKLMNVLIVAVHLNQELKVFNYISLHSFSSLDQPRKYRKSLGTKVSFYAG